MCFLHLEQNAKDGSDFPTVGELTHIGSCVPTRWAGFRKSATQPGGGGGGGGGKNQRQLGCVIVRAQLSNLLIHRLLAKVLSAGHVCAVKVVHNSYSGTGILGDSAGVVPVCKPDVRDSASSNLSGF